MTFEAVERASNRLARALQDAGCVRHDRVGLLLPKSPRAMIAMFGALKAGCIYVPLDTSSPAMRIERILQQCQCRVVVAEASTSGLLEELTASEAWGASTRVIRMDQSAALESFSDADVESHSTPSDAAHILFTSGSTGVPKGVVITHNNIIQFVNWAVKYFGIQAGDRLSGHPPLHFDLSTFDVYGSVAAGAQLHMAPPELNLLPHRLAAFIRESQLNQWFSVPSVLHNLARFDAVLANDFPELKRVLWCGEKFATPDLRYWMRRVPHAVFVNLYGPTETTIASSFYRVPQCPEDDRIEIPIGAACGGEGLLVLDPNLNPTAPGEAGDLYIAGVGLSPGYWRNPSQTAAVFVPNPLAPSERMYKTGDLARIGDDGQVYLIGRADSQIKSRGYRIELGEIEAALAACPGLSDAAIVAIDAPAGEGKEICCAFVPQPGTHASPAALKQRLAAQLPRYMLPMQWRALAELPRNANGKTDRPALRQLFMAAGTAGHAASNS